MNHEHHGSSPPPSGSSSTKTVLTNPQYARVFWYIIAVVLGISLIIRGIHYVEARLRLRRNHQHHPSPTRPHSSVSQAWATATAIVREVSHPQLFLSKRGWQWASPPPLGRSLVLLAYWAVIVYMATYGAVIDDVRYFERIGFRNAWVTVAQIPLVYMLAMKYNPISMITGISYERLNWLHRWIARTIFVTATVHGFHFWTFWARAQYVQLELQILPAVKYGLGAWAVLLWVVVTSFRPLRQVSYEVFVLQHIASAVVMLWLLARHVPSQARQYVWWSVGAMALDRCVRWLLLAWTNFRVHPRRTCCQGMQRVGHEVHARAIGTATTVLTIKDVQFPWRAGQHIYLWVPTLGLLEAHPYTIACARAVEDTCVCNSVQVVVRKHAGFSKRLYEAARKRQKEDGRNLRLTAFVSGPFGMVPRWEAYETLVLVSASTGASFTVPIVEDVVRLGRKACTRRVDVIISTRCLDELEWYEGRLKAAVAAGYEAGIDVHVHLAKTGDSPAVGGAGPGEQVVLSSSSSSTRSKSSSSTPLRPTSQHNERPIGQSTEVAVDVATSGLPMTDMAESEKRVPDSLCKPSKEATVCTATEKPSSPFFHRYRERPNLPALIREPIEDAVGETSVVVCGGPLLTSLVRNCVARLSDERAVHKGSGAQGIHLYVEEYSF